MSPKPIAANSEGLAEPEITFDAAFETPALTLDDTLARTQLEAAELREWTFLMSFHKNMITAVDALRTLRQKTVAPFVVSNSSLEKDLAKFSLPAETSFLDFVSRIYNETRTRSFRIIHSQPYGDTSMYVSAALVDTIVLPRINETSESCSYCTPKPSERILREDMQIYMDPVGLFVDRLGQAVACWSSCKHRGPTQKIQELPSAARRYAISMLEDVNMFEMLPPESRYNPLFVPDLVAQDFYMSQESNQERVDCFGRSFISRAVDATGGSPGVYLELLHDPKDERLAQCQDILGRSALHVTCQYSHSVLVDKLIKAGADINCRTFYGSNPLHYAVTSEQEWRPIYNLLRNDKLDVNAVDCIGRSALWYAVDKNDEKCVIQLLNDKRIQVDVAGINRFSASNAIGTTPLSRAVWRGFEGIVTLLLKHGADPNGNGFPSPLWICIESSNRSVNMLRLLAEHPDIKINEGCFDNANATALSHLATTRWTDGVEILLELHKSGKLSIDLNGVDRYGNTPLLLAVLTCNRSLLSLLSDEQWGDLVDFNHRNHRDNDAAFLAMERDQPTLAEELNSVAAEQRSRGLFLPRSMNR